MRVPGRFGRWMMLGVGGTAMLGIGRPSPAAAQARSAAIVVHATVRDITEADVLGAHAVTPAPPAPMVAGVPDGETWRITSGRGSTVGIRVDGAAGVTICEELGGALGTCEPYRAAYLETTRDGALPPLVIRVGPSAGVERNGTADPPVRLTLAFIDF